ncbi:MAG: SusD/RagB family nutrient-binding outer membrane lipoprotein [Bacteroides sp.]|nr:RagB/SusD family nutrient uptake outer membrane protein [Bacteroides sp.]MBP6065411.1 SusD/RagB family nutrient-binding outer membrane lipoprotein [Bacteroides sp.]MBP6067510.1 SusD/RagB family nutrient-binding outer membrane lipoprotein [Bacteroides sp.]MBP6937465.1 SusD/RagB family nutrient-binding outer membrane lipoprotein [Bacteroides sp.]MBP8621850.1 SusD/RagB family nutrient-binding outer membrane lipoprotein [Bacteroides sp.]
MKMNKSIIRFVLLGTLTGTTIACTNNFEEYNTNPYEATDLTADSYAVRAAMVNMQSTVMILNVNSFQFTDCILGGPMGGYLADSQNGFNGKNPATYSPAQDRITTLLKETIVGIYPNYAKIKKLTDDPVLLSVADIIKVAAMSRVTDVYGPIPYSKVGEDGQLTAPYDSQQQIYDQMFAELDAAINTLTERRTQDFTPLADKVYGGKVVKWVKLANSLKLRLAMRIVNVEPATAQSKAVEAATHPIGTITSNEDNAMMQTIKNPYRVVLHEYNDTRISADLTSYMNGYNDPRREKYFTPSAFEVAGVTNGFIGLRSGVELPGGLTIKQYSNMKVDISSPLLWMNAAESAFLKAEGALRGWSMGGTAKDFYNQGIKLSFEQWQAGGEANYLANSTSTPQVYKDPVNTSFSFEGTPSAITIKWKEVPEFDEENLERIITQKWIANFPHGIEAWSEFRRTGYPKLMPVKYNNSGGKVSTERMARRLNYPQVEYDENSENLQVAISQYLKGPDTMGTDVWWAKKN